MNLTILLLLLAAAQTPAEAVPQEAAARIGVELAATSMGERPGSVTFAELDELLLWRHGAGQQGESALRQLLELRVLDALAVEAGLEITPAMLNVRWAKLDEESRQGGQVGGLAQALEENGIDRATFRRYLRLALVHETLTRRALGLADDAELSAEQQELWLEGAIQARGYEQQPHPYSEGIVATCGDVTIRRDEYVQHLRDQLQDDEKQEACYLLLLEKNVLARMPDLSPEGIERALDSEVERRRVEAEANPSYRGLTYEQLLQAKGLSLDAVRRDPAIRCAALAHLWVDRSTDDEGLRAAYEGEREFFDGLFGEGVDVRALLLTAGKVKNDLVPRTFDEADEVITGLRAQVESVEDFVKVVQQFSEDRTTREQGGLIGLVTRGAINVPAAIREAVFEVLDEREGTVSGTTIGPVRIQGGSVLIMLGGRRPAPTWDVMSQHVHRELRRRFLEEALPRAAVVTWLDEGQQEEK